MPALPQHGDPPFVRTDFSDDGAWRALREAAQGFRARLTVLDDPGFRDLAPERLRRAAPGRAIRRRSWRTPQPSSPERLILCLELPPSARSFRVVPAGLWAMENNRSVANMDFEEFLEEADTDGVLRAT